jgi:cathepsin X
MKARMACRVVALLACLAAASAVSFSATTKFSAGSNAESLSLEVRARELRFTLPPAPLTCPPLPCAAAQLDPPGWKFTACSNPKGWSRPPRVKSPASHETLRGQALPSSLFWGNRSGVNYLTPVRNQHLPLYCGSCWAFATLSSLSDRIKIARNAAYPEVILSPQVIINCNAGGSCNGGDPHGVYEYMAEQGLPDETCQAYVASNGACQPMGICETCEPGVGCAAVNQFNSFGVSEYGDVTGSFLDSVSNADAMKAELFARGPIACDISVTAKFEAYAGGIFSQQRLISIPNHIIAVVGYGVTDNGTEFWIARNSWGTAWGEQGFARILMHRDNLGIERGCTFGVPDVSALKKPKVSFAMPAAVPVPKPAVMAGGACLKRRPGPRTSAVRTPQPHTYLKPSDLPASYDIRNLSGINYATPTRNQHIPAYCGSCTIPEMDIAACVCADANALFITLPQAGRTRLRAR